MGLFSSLFGGGSSSSSTQTTSTTTQNTTQDQRTAAEGEALALGQGASLSINQSVTPEVVSLFDTLIGGFESALDLANKSVSAIGANTGEIYQAAAQVQTDAALSQGAKDTKSLLPFAGIAAAVALVYFLNKR